MSWRFSDDLTMADAGFEASGTSLYELLGSAVEATLAVMVDDPATLQPRRTVRVLLEAEDPAGLLFALLQEVIYRKDAEGVLLRLADGGISERDGRFFLDGVLAGERIDRSRHEVRTDVKAVTLHGFAVAAESGGWRASVVLDV